MPIKRHKPEEIVAKLRPVWTCSRSRKCRRPAFTSL